LICSINPAIVVTKIKSGKDIRSLGSGNPGLTNTLRTQGKGAAIAVLLFDVLKGVISIFFIMLFLWLFMPEIDESNTSFPLNDMFYYRCMWLGALAAVLGHCYPVFYKFKGGKAVLVTVATGLVINWLAALIALVLFILIVLVTKYVSVGSIISAVAYPIWVLIVEDYVRIPVWNGRFHGLGSIGFIFSSIITIILIFKHKENIKRLMNGTEKKLVSKNPHS